MVLRADSGSSFRGGAGGAGAFQKTSVDEAYLEPTRRALAAELLLSEQEGNQTLLCSSAPAKTAVLCSSAPEKEKAGRGLKRPLSRINSVCDPLAPAQGLGIDSESTAGDTSGCALNRGFRQFGDEEKEASDSGGSLGGGGENALEMAVADSPDDGWPEDAWGKRRDGALEAHSRADEEEEDRLLQAGGLLGRRIQQTLSEILKYDCSVGVARNKVRDRTCEPAGGHISRGDSCFFASG